MPMLACIHHVSWVVPTEGGKHTCLYCKEVVAKKNVYPKWEEMGAEYQRKWDAHEQGGTAPATPPPPPAPPAET
jgi:hypothetical protein